MSNVTAIPFNTDVNVGLHVFCRGGAPLITRTRHIQQWSGTKTENENDTDHEINSAGKQSVTLGS